jgi:hypothetical protein
VTGINSNISYQAMICQYGIPVSSLLTKEMNILLKVHSNPQRTQAGCVAHMHLWKDPLIITSV